MRYKVVVTRVQVVERWIKATDEEDAARKIREEFEKPYAYVGHWETKASEVEIVDAAPTVLPSPSVPDESGAVLLSLRDAASALGVPYSALYKLTNQGAIQYTAIGSRRYIPRVALADFVLANTRSGWARD
ncbi:helix-turn-helix domain-containing protein [Microbacterium sp. LWH7-1.2]|uniref:helix-turn-helix domain-containing protein n=1 Tax=Microbacterium sp. LWH7-1.2 TaxID=3135257 RepID=UPI00313868D7